MRTLIVAVMSIALSVAAQFCLKAGMSQPQIKSAFAESFDVRAIPMVLLNKFVLGGFLLYGLGALVWLVVLSKWEVSKAYPLVGLGFVLTLAVGAVLGEHVSTLRVTGVLLIAIGIWVVSFT